MMQLKRKIKLDTDVCCVSGCNRKKGLKFLLTIHRGKQEYPPYCPEHVEEKSREGPVVELPEESEVDDMPETLDEEEAATAAVQTVAITAKTEAETEATDAEETLAMVENFAIEEAGDLDFASELINDVRSKNKRLEELKQQALKPLRETEKTIRSWFTPVQQAYSSIERNLKEKVAAYSRQLEAERKAALEAAEAAVQDGSVEEVHEALAKVEEAQAPTTSGLQVSKVWTFEVIDPDKVPREYLVVSETAIRKAVRDGIRGIPGVNIYQREQVAATGK